MDTKGYCYLGLFETVLMGHPKARLYLSKLRKRLGSNPYVRVVLAELLMLARGDVLLPGVVPVTYGRLHVDRMAEPQLLSDLLAAYMFSRATIGGDVTEEMVEKMDAIQKFTDLCKTAGIETAPAMANAAQRVVSRIATTNADLVTGMLRTGSKKLGDRFPISYQLETSAAARLANEYPELNVVFGSVPHPHAYAAAATLCQEELILRRCRYDRKNTVPKDFDAAIVDIGANYHRHAKAGRTTIHCCSPIIEHRDSARDTTRANQLQHLVSKNIITQRTCNAYTDGKGSLQRCYNLAQDCYVTAPYGMLIHGQYDISIADLGKMCDAHQFEQVFSVIIFDVGMLFKESGVVAGVEMNYYRDGSDIVCGYVGDSSVSYRHKLSNIQEIIRTTIMVTPKGRVYYCEKTTRGGAVFLHYVYCRRKPLTATQSVDFSVWYPQDESAVLLSTFEFDQTVFGDSKVRTVKDPILRFKRRFIEVDKRFFELLLGHCIRSGDKSFNLNECFSAANTFNTRMCINGNDVRTVNRVASEDLLTAVVCIYCIAYRDRWIAGKGIEAFAKSEKEKRAKGRVTFWNFVEYAWKKSSGPRLLNSIGEIWNDLITDMAELAEVDQLSAAFFRSVREVRYSEFLTVSGEYEDHDLPSILMDVKVDSFAMKMENDHLKEVCDIVRSGLVGEKPELSKPNVSPKLEGEPVKPATDSKDLSQPGTPAAAPKLVSVHNAASVKSSQTALTAPSTQQTYLTQESVVRPVTPGESRPVSSAGSLTMSISVDSAPTMSEEPRPLLSSGSLAMSVSEISCVNSLPVSDMWDRLSSVGSVSSIPSLCSARSNRTMTRETERVRSALVDSVRQDIISIAASEVGSVGSGKQLRMLATKLHMTGTNKSEENSRRLSKARKDAFSYTCSGRLTHVPMPADGHCLFHALAHVIGSTALEVRKQIKAATEPGHDTSHLDIVDGSRAGWGRIEDTIVFSRMTGIRICTHIVSPHVSFATDAYSAAELPETAPVAHLHWQVDGDPMDASYTAHVDLLVDNNRSSDSTLAVVPELPLDSPVNITEPTAVVTPVTAEIAEVVREETVSNEPLVPEVPDKTGIAVTMLPDELKELVGAGVLPWKELFARVKKRKNRDVFSNLHRVGVLPDRLAYELDDLFATLRTHTEERFDLRPTTEKYKRLCKYWDASGGDFVVDLKAKEYVWTAPVVYRVRAHVAEDMLLKRDLFVFRSKFTAYNDDYVYVVNGLQSTGDLDAWRVATVRSLASAYTPKHVPYTETLIKELMVRGYCEDVLARINALVNCKNHVVIRSNCVVCIYVNEKPKLTTKMVEAILKVIEPIVPKNPMRFFPDHKLAEKAVQLESKRTAGYSTDGNMVPRDERQTGLVTVVRSDAYKAGKAMAAPGKHQLRTDAATVTSTVYGVEGTSKMSFLGDNRLRTIAEKPREVAIREISAVNVVVQPKRVMRSVGCGTDSQTITVSDEFRKPACFTRCSMADQGTQAPDAKPLARTVDAVVPTAAGALMKDAKTETQVIPAKSKLQRVASLFSVSKKSVDENPVDMMEIIKSFPVQKSADQLVRNAWWVSFPHALRTHLYLCVACQDGRLMITKELSKRLGVGITVPIKTLRTKGYTPFTGAISGWWRTWLTGNVEHYDVLIVDNALPLDTLQTFLSSLPEDVCRVTLDFAGEPDPIRLIDVLRIANRKVLLTDVCSGARSYAAVVAVLHPPKRDPVVEKPMVTMPKLNAEDLGKVRDPQLLPGDSREIAYRNAMLEFKHLTANADNFNAAKYKAMLQESKNGMSSDVLDNLRRSQMNVYDNRLKRFLLTGQSRTYSHGYAKEGYVAFDEKNQRFETTERYVITGRSTELMLNQRIAQRMETVPIDRVFMPVIEWTNGPPGCGKTYHIIQNAHIPISTAQEPEDLVLCMTTEGRRDVMAKMKSKRPEMSDEVLQRDVRTVASVLVNGCAVAYQRVLLDEALMAHAGTIGFVVYYSQAKAIAMIGDIHQIPYVDREHMCSVLYHVPSRFADITKSLNRTYRCPVDVTYALSAFYEGLHTTNGIILSVRQLTYSGNVTHIDKACTNTLFLVHLQADKDALVSEGYGKASGSAVLTVHEAQGLTFNHVICIRRNSKPLEIFSSLPYAIVAISRHRESFVYYTDAEDAITGLVKKAKTLDASSLSVWNRKRYAANLSAGGVMRAPMTIREDTHRTDENLTRDLPADTHNVLVLEKDTGISFALKEKPSLKGVWEEDLSYLQLWYDDKLPGAAVMENMGVQEWMETEDTFVSLDSISVNPSLGIMRKSGFGKLRPRLRTFMFPTKRPSFKESLLGAVKRNLNAPKLANDALDPDCIGRALFTNFIRSAIPAENLALLDMLSADTVSLSSHLVDKWLDKQAPAVRRQILSETPLHLRYYNSFSYMIKGDVKPQLELSAIQKYPSVQTIVYSDKNINAIFCPVFGVLFERLLNLLDERILVFTGMSPHEFEKELNARIAGLDLSEVVTVEEDMSKYDKAQGRALRQFEDLLWDALGMDPDLLRIWTDSHVRSHVRDRRNGIGFDTEYQRKSGDATTFAGNTLVILAVLLGVYDIDDIALIMVAGDDSYIFFKPGCAHLPDPSRRIADLFNLECKLLRNFSVPYFCSKFLIQTPQWTYLVPDPLKFVTKLGRLDMANYKHVEEYRVSCNDTMSALFNPVVAEGLSIAVQERYGGDIADITKLINILRSLCSCPAKFASLFVHDYGVRLSFDPSTTKLN